MDSRNRNAFCSFCRKSYRDVGPLVEGPGEVYICGECVELSQSIIEQERKRRGTAAQRPAQKPADTKNQARKLLGICLEGVDSWSNSILKKMNKKELNRDEIAMLEEIRARAAQLKTLVAGRVKKGASS